MDRKPHDWPKPAIGVAIACREKALLFRFGVQFSRWRRGSAPFVRRGEYPITFSICPGGTLYHASRVLGQVYPPLTPCMLDDRLDEIEAPHDGCRRVFRRLHAVAEFGEVCGGQAGHSDVAHRVLENDLEIAALFF